MTDDIAITHFDNVMQTPCFLPAIRHYLHTVENGQGMHMFPWSNRDPCFAAMLGDTCIGGMIYVIETNLSRVHINYSFVESGHRGRGIYGMMFAQLESRARQLNLRAISSLVRVTNQSQLRASAKAGMEPAYYRMMKFL